jgi:tetratricopeptide (TPR) repeat protein
MLPTQQKSLWQLSLLSGLFFLIINPAVSHAGLGNPFSWGKNPSEKAPINASDQAALTPTTTNDLPQNPADTKTSVEVSKPSPTTDHSADTLQAKAFYNQGVDTFQLAQFQGSRGNHTGQFELYKAAEKHFKKALKLDPTLVEAKTNLGYLWLAQEQPKKAIPAFQAALKINPNHLSALNGLANAYVLQKELPQAEATFEQLIKLAPGQADYWFNLGSVFQKEGKPEEATHAYQQALKAEPDHQRALFNLATLSHNQGDLNEAKRYYEQAKKAGIETPIGLEVLRRLRTLDTTQQGSEKIDTSSL